MSQNGIGRASALLKKYVNIQKRSLRPTSIKGRFIGPKVLMNSLPKAGTNLLEQALNQYPLLHRSGFRTLRDWEALSDSTVRRLQRLERGGVTLGHLPAHPPLIEALDKYGIKVLFMIRDPRDMLVSYVKYVTSIDVTHPAHRYFLDLPNDHSRLLAVINGVDGIVSPISVVLEKFSGWLDSGAMVIRFEDIIGPKGGGSKDKQLKVVYDIAEFLGIKIESGDAEKISSAIYSPRSITFRKAKVNSWQGVFEEEHIQALDVETVGLLKKYGYGVE